MRRRLLPFSVVLAAGALLALLGFGVAHQGTTSSIDAEVARGQLPKAPSATAALPNLDGIGTRSLASLRGQVVVLNVFASWCGPCKFEAPVLEDAERQIAGDRATVLGVTYLDTVPAVEGFVRVHRITYPVVRDVSGDFVRSWGTTGVPETFIIDRTGRVAAVRRFQVDQSWLAKTLPPILARRA